MPFTRAEAQRRYRRRKAATAMLQQADETQLRLANEILRSLAAGAIPEPQPNWLKAAAQQRRLNSNGDAQPVPEPIIPNWNNAAVAQPEPVPEPADRPAFIPSEDFRNMIQLRANLDLIDAVLRTCTGTGHGIGTRDIAAACQADHMPVLKLLAFLHSEKLLFDSDRDGQWRAVPGALGEWQHRLNTARSMPPMPSTTEPDLLPPGLFKIPSS